MLAQLELHGRPTCSVDTPKGWRYARGNPALHGRVTLVVDLPSDQQLLQTEHVPSGQLDLLEQDDIVLLGQSMNVLGHRLTSGRAGRDPVDVIRANGVVEKVERAVLDPAFLLSALIFFDEDVLLVVAVLLILRGGGERVLAV